MAATVVLAAVGGVLWPVNPLLGAGFCLALLWVLIAVVRPAWLLVAVLPGAFLAERVVAGGIDLALSDWLLLLTLPVALFQVGSLSKALKGLLAIEALYLIILAMPLVLHPSGTALLEWMHRGLMIGGGAMVGAALVNLGWHRRAIRFYVAAAAMVAVWAIVDGLVAWPAAAAPAYLEKNFAGDLISLGLLIVLASPDLVPRRPLRAAAMVALIGGLAATQSRGALIGCAVGAIYIVVRRRHFGIAGSLTVLAGVGAAAFTFFSLSDQTSDPRLNSIGSRSLFLREAWAWFVDAPLTGQGLRFYTNPVFGFPTPAGEPSVTPSPHNIILEVLAESGILGLVALMLLLGGAVVLLGRARPSLAVAAGAVQIDAIVHSVVDIYWLAGMTTLIWVLTSMGITAGRGGRVRSLPPIGAVGGSGP